MNALPPRFSLLEAEEDVLRTAWRVWIDAITSGYFGDERSHPRCQAITVEGLATGLAWFAVQASGRRCVGRRRVDKAHRRGEFGPGRGMRDGMVESLANATLRFARAQLLRVIPDIDQSVATLEMQRAAMDAFAGFFSSSDFRTAAMEALWIEFLETYQTLSLMSDLR